MKKFLVLICRCVDGITQSDNSDSFLTCLQPAFESTNFCFSDMTIGSKILVSLHLENY